MCYNYGVCKILFDGNIIIVNCNCEFGYMGVDCRFWDYCSIYGCVNGGMCVNIVNFFFCVC